MRKLILRLAGIVMLGLSCGTNSIAVPVVIQDLTVTRITDLGPRRIDQGEGRFGDSEAFAVEFGTLYCKGDFIPSGYFEDSVFVGDEAGPDTAGLTEAERLKALSGQNLMALSTYTALARNQGTSLKCFPRSPETYSFDRHHPTLSPNVPYVAVANQPGAKAGPVPVVSLAPLAEDIGEGETAEFMIALNGPSSRDVIVRLSIKGTARNGRDYTRLQRRIRIPAGNVSTIVAIEAKTDRREEGVETVEISVKPNSKYGISSQSTATIRISD